MSSAELLEQVMCSGLLVGWVAGGPCRRYPFNTLDLSSGTLFLCQSGHLLSSLLSSQNIHCLAAVFLPLFIMKLCLVCLCVDNCVFCAVCACMHADICVLCVCACMQTRVVCVCACMRIPVCLCVCVCACACLEWSCWTRL